MRIEVRARASARLRCSFCHDDLPRDAQRCPGCDTRTHLACWEELKGCCPTLGCVPRTEGAPDRPRIGLSRILGDLFLVGVVAAFTTYMCVMVGALLMWLVLMLSALIA